MNEKLLNSPEEIIRKIERLLDVNKIWNGHGWTYMPMSACTVEKCLKIIHGEIK